jgi:hypothetical protein
MAFRSLILHSLCSIAAVQAVTIYGQQPLTAQLASTSTSGAAAATSTGPYVGLAAYDPTTWPPPAVTSPPPLQFGLAPPPAASDVTGLSINTPSSFFGISIEMSVANQVCEYRHQI